MSTTIAYTVQAATEFGIGRGPNGTGRREKVSGYYVMRNERRIRGFTGKDAKAQAEKWATFCAEHCPDGVWR
jgi:hypothetical protein